jgi:proline racemase
VAIESILGTTMTIRVVDQNTFGAHEQVVPEVGGTSCIMSRSEFYFDSKGPSKDGFMLNCGDIPTDLLWPHRSRPDC